MHTSEVDVFCHLRTAGEWMPVPTEIRVTELQRKSQPTVTFDRPPPHG